ncbi:MAG: hypothetical protein JWR62_1417 [Modestobacter sp.]|jgi:hypothetical protein|nr:hypothetical protein [Modestobacter sp.]
MDIDEAYALLAELEVREVEDLGTEYFEAELAELLPLAAPAARWRTAGPARIQALRHVLALSVR